MNKLFDRYKKWLGEKAEGLVDNYDLKTCIRVNTLKIKPKDLARRLEKKGVKLEKIEFLKNGYRVIDSPFSLGSTNEYLQGYYYIQEAASQYPVEIMEIESEDVILDMAAAPGGKTTQIAAFLKNKGKVIALDNKTRRLEALRNNCARLGVNNVLIVNKDARFALDLEIEFDKVLLDAPCSGNFVNDSEWFKKRNVSDFEDRAKIQRELLGSAFDVLKAGGILVYSTCSLEVEEDEENVEWFKSEFEVELLDMKKFWPHIDNTQGFFVAKFRKK